MKLLITKADNGYILSDPEDPQFLQVFASGEEDGKESVTELLTEIASYLGYSYDKFKDDNLNITFDKKGHKLE